LKISREVKVAIFVVIAGTMLYTGFNFLKGIDLLRSTRKFYALYPNVNGLKVSNSVIVNGLSVGRISEIKIMNDAKNTLEVAFDIDKSIILGDSAKAIIASLSILGDKVLLLELGNVNKPVEEKSYIKGELESDLTTKISSSVDPIMKNIMITTDQLNKILGNDNVKALSTTFKNLEKTTLLLNNLMAANADNINSTTGNLKKLTASLVETEKELKPLLQKTNTIADSLTKMQLAATVATANRTIADLDSLLTGINKGEGTLGQLAKNDSLYVYLKNTSRDLDKLLVNFREKPSRYVHFSLFGKKDK
jgi:phospholipid/cholesterol/gamma-HCH transport system substrate-binding protein